MKHHPTLAEMRGIKPKRAALSVCALTETEARLLEEANIGFKCSSGRHPHYSRKRVDELVALGDMQWVGKHRQKAQFVSARSLMKVYRRDFPTGPGEPTMQLVRGGAIR